MTRFLAIASFAALAACAPEPAASVSFTSGFSDQQLDVAQDVLDQWCDAVGWCPIVTLDGELHVRAESAAEYARHGRPSNSRGFHGGSAFLDPAGRTLYVDVTALDAYLDAGRRGLAWTVLAHELGHEGLDHLPAGVMAAVMRDPNPPTCIDAAAVRAWCDEWGCPQDAASTCVADPAELTDASE